MCDILSENLVDIFFLMETKLDVSFPPKRFHVKGFAHYTRKRNCRICTSRPASQMEKDLENQVNMGIESMMIEVIIRTEKWLFLGVYKPPKLTNDAIINSLVNTLNTQQNVFKSTCIMGTLT